MKTQKLTFKGTVLMLTVFIPILLSGNGPAGHEFTNTTESIELEESGNMNILSMDMEHALFGTSQASVDESLRITNLRVGTDSFYNFPDPFTGVTSLVYELSQISYVVLKVYYGYNEVALLVDEVQLPGQHTVNWNSGDLPPGEYTGFLITNKGTFLEMMIKVAPAVNQPGID
jgi:hypothetical protein